MTRRKRQRVNEPVTDRKQIVDFEKPTRVDDVLLAFPATVRDLMPAYQDIPEEYKHDDHPAVKFQSRWFFGGLKAAEIPQAKAGIDREMALRHLRCIHGSYEPKHEHKMAAVAYLADKWLVISR